MKIIKTESAIFNDKTYTIKFGEDSKELSAQAFQGIVPVSYLFTTKIAQTDQMRRHHIEPIDWLKKRVVAFVEECNRLGIGQFMLKTDKHHNQAFAKA